MTDPAATGLRLRQARIKCGLSRRQAAKASGLSQSTIQRAEQEGTTNLDHIRRLGTAYGAHPIGLAHNRKEILEYLAQLLRGQP